MRMVKIYLLNNLGAQRRYVGITGGNLPRLRHRYRADAKRFGAQGNNQILSDIIKYGLTSFTLTLLETVDEDWADERKEYYIKYFETMAPKGYNTPHPEGTRND